MSLFRTHLTQSACNFSLMFIAVAPLSVLVAPELAVGAGPVDRAHRARGRRGRDLRLKAGDLLSAVSRASSNTGRPTAYWSSTGRHSTTRLSSRPLMRSRPEFFNSSRPLIVTATAICL